MWQRVGVDAEPLPVDCDVVMEPARRRQVLRIVVATVDVAPDVVRLEPIPAHAAHNDTATIAMRREPSDRYRDPA